jgi:hypothetical protein
MSETKAQITPVVSPEVGLADLSGPRAANAMREAIVDAAAHQVPDVSRNRVGELHLSAVRDGCRAFIASKGDPQSALPDVRWTSNGSETLGLIQNQGTRGKAA